MVSESIDNPILNSPYEQPDRYYEVGPQGPTGQVREGRRPSESFIPIAVAKKGTDAGQSAFDFDATGERRERNSLINDLRRDVAAWRRGGDTPGLRRSAASCCSTGPTRTGRTGCCSVSARPPRRP